MTINVKGVVLVAAIVVCIGFIVLSAMTIHELSVDECVEPAQIETVIISYECRDIYVMETDNTLRPAQLCAEGEPK